MDSQTRSRRTLFAVIAFCLIVLLLLSTSETVRTPFQKGRDEHHQQQIFDNSTRLADLKLPKHDRAYAAFLSGPTNDTGIDNDDNYYVGVRILAYQILHNAATRTNDSIPFLVLVTDDVNQSKRAQLMDDGATVIPVERIAVDWVTEGTKRARWKDVMTKLRLWQLTQYQRILFLDSDMILAGPLDGVFDDPAAQVRKNGADPDQAAKDESIQPSEYVFGSVAGQGSWDHDLPPRKGDYLNAGFVMLGPSQVMFDHYLSVAALEGRFDPKLPEQNLWNYVHRHTGNMPFGNLDPMWNVNRVTMRDVKFGIKSLHMKWWNTQESNKKADPELRDFALSKKWMMEGSAQARKDLRSSH